MSNIDFDKLNAEIPQELPTALEMQDNPSSAPVAVEAKPRTVGDIILDDNVTADSLREGVKKEAIIRAASDETYQKKSAKIEATRQLSEAELEAEARTHELTAENLTKEQREAAEYYNYHTVVLNFIGIRKALSVKAMKFFYYFALPFFCVISVIRIVFNAVQDIVEKTLEMLTGLYVKFMEFVEKASSSTSKAVKALGVFIIIVTFVGAALLVIYIGCQIIGFDLFGIIRSAIKGG